MNLSPIVLFVYNRPYHTKQTIEALEKNDLATDSRLFIYSDAPKDEASVKAVLDVRKYLKTISGFKQITIFEREHNVGLADSIIDGVTKIVNEYGKIIVLEDDLVTSPYFLKFMNESLDFYKNEKKVWHISGWNYPCNYGKKDETFLWKKMNCWGWGTWIDRWELFEKNPIKIQKIFTKKQVYEFNIDGTDYNWQQIEDNIDKKISTWAVFWHATIFLQKGLCLNPYYSFVKNIGYDGSGTHCGQSNVFDIKDLNDTVNMNMVTDISENLKMKEVIKSYLLSKKKSFIVRCINKISRLIFGKNCI
jgi:hypothetical protein